MTLKAPDTIQVEVWDYEAQTFIPCIRCPGEYRVRVDHHGSLANLGVFAVARVDEREFTVIDGNRPLQWRIDYS